MTVVRNKLGLSPTNSKMDKSDDSLGGPGDRVRRTRRQPQSGGLDDLDKSEDFNSLVKKDPPRRTLSGELDSSLVIGDKNWRTLDTVHKHKFDFDDSESLMDDSFAGSSFASTTDSLVDSSENDARSRFTQLDDETAPVPPGGKPGLPGQTAPRRNTPRRTYSKQRKQMPKKSDPLSAISEDDSGDVEE